MLVSHFIEKRGTPKLNWLDFSMVLHFALLGKSQPISTKSQKYHRVELLTGYPKLKSYGTKTRRQNGPVFESLYVQSRCEPTTDGSTV
jgi:hypothetical protein